MGVAHALANHRAQSAPLQKPTHSSKQLGSDPNFSKNQHIPQNNWDLTPISDPNFSKLDTPHAF
jgi:hypothetical protein